MTCGAGSGCQAGSRSAQSGELARCLPMWRTRCRAAISAHLVQEALTLNEKRQATERAGPLGPPFLLRLVVEVLSLNGKIALLDGYLYGCAVTDGVDRRCCPHSTEVEGANGAEFQCLANETAGTGR